MGIIALLDKLTHIFGVIGDPKTVAAFVGTMLFVGALCMWSWLPGMMWPCRCKTFDKCGLIIVLVAHVFLIVPPIGATYCHSVTGDPVAPPILVGLLGVTHLVLWLVIQQKKVEPTPIVVAHGGSADVPLGTVELTAGTKHRGRLRWYGGWGGGNGTDKYGTPIVPGRKHMLGDMPCTTAASLQSTTHN